MGTDLRVADFVEVPAASGIFYTIVWTERIHLGFPNEYFAGLAVQGMISPPPPVGGGILLETGDFILTEAGFHILLE